MKRILLFAGLLVAIASFASAYTVVLKNGKTIQGTLVSENDEMCIVKDSSGIQLNLKKSNVDLEKTAAANQPLAASEKSAPPADSPNQDAVKKPARKITEEDLEKLREKYDLGEGTFSKNRETGEGEAAWKEVKPPVEKRSDDQWRSEAAQRRAEIQRLEKSAAELKYGCEFTSGLTIQGGDSIVNPQGERLSIAETHKEICGQAEILKAALERAREEYEAFMMEAKTEGVPPGLVEDREK
jgi:hypothetical protein